MSVEDLRYVQESYRNLPWVGGDLRLVVHDVFRFGRRCNPEDGE